MNIQGTLNVLRPRAARGEARRLRVLRGDLRRRADAPESGEHASSARCRRTASKRSPASTTSRRTRKLYGVETVALRYFNVFGPRQDPSSAYSGVISIFVDRALKGERPKIFGDGSQCRDFVFVANVVDANYRAATASGVSGRSYNVGCGKRTTLNELWAMIRRIVGSELQPILRRAPRRRHS